MPVVDEYVACLTGKEREIIAHLYALVLREVPDAAQEVCYAMPAYKYKGKGLVAIMANKDFLSLYPFCAVDRLGLDLSAFECTSGSIHFTAAKPLPDDLMHRIVAARKAMID